MINKKTSNTIAVLVALWASVMFLVFVVEHWNFLGNDSLAWLAIMATMLLIPMLVIFANGRSNSAALAPIDQILQLLFYGLWLLLWFVGVLVPGELSLTVLSAVLSVALVILVKSVLGKKITSGPQAAAAIRSSGKEGRPAKNKKVLLLTLNILTIWIPLGVLVGCGTYISIRFAGVIDSGFMIIPILLVTGPLLAVGIVVAILTLIWLVRNFLTKRADYRWPVFTLGIVWGLASAAYIGLWVWLLANIFGLIHS